MQKTESFCTIDPNCVSIGVKRGGWASVGEGGVLIVQWIRFAIIGMRQLPPIHLDKQPTSGNGFLLIPWLKSDKVLI